MMSLSLGAPSAPFKKPLRFSGDLGCEHCLPSTAKSFEGKYPGAEFPPDPVDILKTSLELRTRFVAQLNELAQKLKTEIMLLGRPDPKTVGKIQDLREQHAQELLPLDRHNLTIMRTLPPDAIADELVAGLQKNLGPNGFEAFRQYLKGRPDDLLAFALEQQRKLMSIIPAIGKQYGREAQDALELPVLAFPLMLKQSSRMVAEKGREILKLFMNLMLRPQLEQSIANAHGRIQAKSPSLSETQAEHLMVLAQTLRVATDKLNPVCDALIKRLF